MTLKKHALITLLLVSMQALAGNPAQNHEPSDADLKQLQMDLCRLSAETARSITSATIKAKRFNAEHEVIDQTEPGSGLREVMQKLFQNDGLVSTVLIQSASFGASMMPSPVGEKNMKDIEELTFQYVLSICISALHKN